MPPAASTALAIVGCVLVLAFTLLSVALFMTFFSTWLKAFLSGTPVMILDLIGMRMRGTDFKAVVRALIIARQGDVIIPPAEMEKAWVQGVDLDRVTLAIIRARKDNIDVTFQELVDADLDHRLARLLEEKREAPLEEPACR
jgi:uncharacterized protein YqfA (UPF0365 family)